MLSATEEDVALAGFERCYQVVATQGDYRSASNVACVTFENALFIPNVITPNGDARNDLWIIPQLPLYPNTRVRLFDRWGRPCFSTDDYQNDWDATGADGGALPAGTYFYELITTTERAASYRGWLQVLR